MFVPSSRETELHDAITRVEVLHTNFIAQHNLSFLLSDHMSKLYEKIFPNSKIAKRFACSRTKTASILNGAMMHSLMAYLTAYMKIDIFAIVNNGSSDTGLEKINVVYTHIFDAERSNKVELKFFNMCTTSGEHCSTAESPFNAIDNVFTSDEISWEQCVSIRLDNANVNDDVKSSIKSRVQQRNKSCFIAGCSCHLVHTAASNGGSSYSRVSGFDMADHMVHLYYYFKSSTKRKEILLEFLKFLDMEWEGLGKYVANHWLSFKNCVEKELKNYPGLKSTFLSRNPDNASINDGRQEEGHIDKLYKARGKRLKKAFSDSLIEVHVSFYDYCIATVHLLQPISGCSDIHL